MNRPLRTSAATGLLLAYAICQVQAANWQGSSGDDTLIFTGNGAVTANGIALTDIQQADGGGGSDVIRFDAPQSSAVALEFRNFEDFIVDLSGATPLLSAPEVVISGQLSLQNFSGSYAPGDFFELIDADTIGGSFSGYDLPDVSDQELAWYTEDLPTLGLLRLVSSGPPVLITERSQPSGLVNRDVSQAIGTVYQVNSPPIISGSRRFAFWTFNGIRQENANGRAQFRPTTVVTQPVEAIAQYLEDGVDGDGDRMDDWWEFWVFGSRDSAPDENADGDVFDNIVEFERSLDPLSVDLPRSGGVSLRASGTVSYIKTGAYNYTLVSEPVGLVRARGRLVAGATYTSPSITSEQSGYAFVGYWVNGVRQVDSSGVSLTQFSTTPSADFTVVARFVLTHEESDADGIPDAHEYRFYGDLDQNAGSDFDEDGISDGVEYARSFSANTVDSVRSGGISLRASPTTVFAVGKSRFTQSSIPFGLIAQTEAYVDDSSTRLLPLQRPASPSGFDFAYWQVNGVRLVGGSGVSLREAEITVVGNTDAVAHFVATGMDSDTDGIRDWQELFNFGTLDNDPSDDPDEDGFTLQQEIERSLSPRLSESARSGGISLRGSPVIFYPGDLIGYEIQSEPFGLLPRSQGYAASGTQITTDRVQMQTAYSGYRFVYWTLNGERQRDGVGTSREQAAFMLNEETEVVAHYVLDGVDADADTIPDHIELRYASELSEIGPDSDLDGDGISVGAEVDNSLSPLLVDRIRSGGISLRGSAVTLADFTISLDGYYAWIQGIFPEAAIESGENIHLLDDYDGDGIENLLEYAFGMDILSPDANQFLAQSLKIYKQGTDGIQLRYGGQSPTPERVFFEIQSSPDLKSWKKMRRSEFEIEQAVSGGILWETLSQDLVADSAETLFYRLRVYYK